MKKFIIPVAAAAAAGIAAVGLIAANTNKPAVDDKPEPPEELPSGNYYVDGDPANDNLYLVVDGKNIHYASSGDLREAFQARDLILDPRYKDDPDALDRQTDVTMSQWGAENYTYTLTNWPGDSGDLVVRVSSADHEEGTISGGSMIYHTDTNTFHSFAGDLVLAKTE
ncbi:MAG: hypothetical protein K2N56_07370 [Oscillospiraceae bacterium]|nr:hypothetical protein [Oscillospiraceae bacterium]